MTLATRRALWWDRYHGIVCETQGIDAHDELIYDHDYACDWARFVREGGRQWYDRHVPAAPPLEKYDEPARARYIIRIGIWASSLIDGDGDAD